MISKWPVVNPPIEPHPPRINLRGTPPDPATFDGSLNVFIELHGTAVACNTADETKKIYDTDHPAEPVADPPPPAPAPIGTPISPGQRITPDPSKFEIDPGITDRVNKRRLPRYTV